MPRKRRNRPEVTCPAADWQAFVLSQLGTPDDLARVQTVQLHDDRHFRVNVFRTIRDRPTLTDSFYLVVTPEGPVTYPPIARRYFDDQIERFASSGLAMTQN